MKWRYLFLAMVFASVGCGERSHETPLLFPASPDFKGRITLIIAEPHKFGEGDTDRTYQYDLGAGRLELMQVKDSADEKVEIQHFATGGVSCYNSPHLQSPDGKLVAYCEGPFPGLPRGTQSDSIVVEDTNGKPVLKHPVDSSLRLVGYAWAPDARSLAVAESSSRTSLNPLDLLWAVAGHPIPISRFEVQLFTIDGKATKTLPFLQGEYRLGFGMLAGWN